MNTIYLNVISLNRVPLNMVGTTKVGGHSGGGGSNVPEGYEVFLAKDGDFLGSDGEFYVKL